MKKSVKMGMVLTVLMFAFGCFVGCSKKASSEDVEKIAEIAREANAICPIQVDALTTMVSVESSDNVLIYKYEVDKLSKVDFDVAKENMKSAVKTILKMNPETEELRKIHADLEFNYYDTNDELLGRIGFKYSEY